MWREEQVYAHRLIFRYCNRDRELAPLANRAFDENSAAHLLDQTRRDRVAESRPRLRTGVFVVRAPEFRAELLDGLRRHADARVADAELDLVLEAAYA